MRSILIFSLFAGLATPLVAQQFTSAAEVKPILGMTRASWVAVREYEGEDLLYFTHLASFRCGLAGVRYGINGAPTETPFVFEPCYRDEPAPNAQKMENGELPFVTFPLGSVLSVSVLVSYADGTTESADFARAAIQIN